MIFTAVDGVEGAWAIDEEAHEDSRGRFARTYERSAWEAHGLTTDVDHLATSSNWATGTMRGLHLQSSPYGEAKTVRCTRGRVFDVLVDARPGPGFGRWSGFALAAGDGRSLHLPVGVAHGFLTLEANAEVSYVISAPYNAKAAGGFRWDDPAIGIDWPAGPAHLSERDRDLPLLADWAAAQEHR